MYISSSRPGPAEDRGGVIWGRFSEGAKRSALKHCKERSVCLVVFSGGKEERDEMNDERYERIERNETISVAMKR